MIDTIDTAAATFALAAPEQDATGESPDASDSPGTPDESDARDDNAPRD